MRGGIEQGRACHVIHFDQLQTFAVSGLNRLSPHHAAAGHKGVVFVIEMLHGQIECN